MFLMLLCSIASSAQLHFDGSAHRGNKKEYGVKKETPKEVRHLKFAHIYHG